MSDKNNSEDQEIETYYLTPNGSLCHHCAGVTEISFKVPKNASREEKISEAKNIFWENFNFGMVKEEDAS